MTGTLVTIANLIGRGPILLAAAWIMDPAGKPISLPGHHTTEPTFGLPATWIDLALRDEAELRGYSIIDPSTVISTPSSAPT